MGLNFNGSTDFMSYDGSLIDETAQLSFSLWVQKDDDASTSRRAMQFRDDIAGFMISINGDGAGYVHVISGNSSGNWGTSASDRQRAIATNDVYHHVCGTVSTGTSTKTVEAAFLDGVAMSDTAGGAWGSGVDNDTVTIGARAGGVGKFNGKVAEVAIWEGFQFTAEQALALASGMPADLLQSDKLKFYTTLQDINAGAIIGGAATLFDSPDNFEHAPITKAIPLIVPSIAAVVGGGAQPIIIIVT